MLPPLSQRARPEESVAVHPPRLTLRRNFVWTFSGNLVSSGSQWGSLIVLAWLGSPEMVGEYALGWAVTAPLFMFTNLQLRNVQATDARRDFSFGDYFAARLLLTGAALPILMAMVWFSNRAVEVAAIIIVVAAAKAFESLGDILHGLLQQHERMDRIALSMMLRGTFSLFLLAATVRLTHRLLWGVIALAVVWASVVLFFDCRNARRFLTAEETWGGLPKPRWRAGVLARLFWLALPLGVVTCLISLNSNVPRYFLEYYWDLKSFGIFSALGYLMIAGNTVVAALGNSALPRLAEQYATGQHIAFRRLLGKLVALGGLLGVAGIAVALVAGKPLLQLLYGSAYAEQHELFVLLMCAGAISYASSFLGYGATAARYFRVQTPIFVVVGLATTTASALLIPTHGLMGAGWAVLLAALCQFGLLSVVLLFAVRTPKAEA